MTATRGIDGIRLAKTQKPDLILLDVMMPGMTGTDVAEELSGSPITASIPIIFVTAVVRQNEVDQSSGFIGGRRFIAKPFVIDELLEKISAV